ncbi:hypothetical protein GF402_02290 [Candidatus Fermentibacteria bacterium]|nr:hypothetical protein [Candidatus Fermentibacteria bacterium]
MVPPARTRLLPGGGRGWSGGLSRLRVPSGPRILRGSRDRLRRPKPVKVFRAAMILLSLASQAAAHEASQGSWSGGPSAGFPVRAWSSSFRSSNHVNWWTDDSELTLGYSPECIGIQARGEGASQLLAFDVDSDGDVDITALELRGNITWFENLGAGRSFVIHSLRTFDAFGPDMVVEVDMDSDGDLDMAACSRASESLGIYWLENTGSDPWPVHAVYDSGGGCGWVDAGDIDADGDPDLVAAFPSEGALVWMDNPGAAEDEWAEHRIEVDLTAPWCVRAVDLEGNGSMEILVSDFDTHRILLLRPEGSGWRKELLGECPGPSCLTQSDLNGDGIIDVLACSSWEDRLYRFSRTGGEWLRTEVAKGIVAPEHVGAADLDGDGDPDIFASSRVGNEVSWWENLGTRSFALHRVGMQQGCSWVCAANMDSDDRLELATASMADGSLCWWNLFDHAYSGRLDSEILYLGGDPAMGMVEWTARKPPGTSVEVQVRISPDRLRMGEWHTLSSSPAEIDRLFFPGCAYLQYRILLGTDNRRVSPFFEEIRLGYSDSPFL